MIVFECEDSLSSVGQDEGIEVEIEIEIAVDQDGLTKNWGKWRVK
jgi:hypothetical protein